MRLTATRSHWLAALGTVVLAAVKPGKSTLPVLSSVHLTGVGPEDVILRATNLELSISALLPGAQHCERGTALAPAHDLYGAIKACAEGPVTLLFQAIREEARREASVTVTDGRLSRTLPCFPDPDEMPLDTADTTATRGVLPTAALLGAIGRVAPCAAPDESRMTLTSVLLEFDPTSTAATAVATDGYRLAVETLICPTVPAEKIRLPWPARNAVLYAKAVAAYKPQGTVTLLNWHGYAPAATRHYATMLTLTHPGLKVTSRLIEGEFINYGQVIPSTYPVVLAIDVDAWLAAVGQYRQLGTGKAGTGLLCYLELGTPTGAPAHEPRLVFQGPEEAHLEVALPTTGELRVEAGAAVPRMCANPLYLHDALLALGKGQRGYLLMNTRPTPFVFQNLGGTFMSLTMPMAGGRPEDFTPLGWPKKQPAAVFADAPATVAVGAVS